jgi:hypothetical protein
MIFLGNDHFPAFLNQQMIQTGINVIEGWLKQKFNDTGIQFLAAAPGITISNLILTRIA